MAATDDEDWFGFDSRVKQKTIAMVQETKPDHSFHRPARFAYPAQESFDSLIDHARFKNSSEKQSTTKTESDSPSIGQAMTSCVDRRNFSAVLPELILSS